jgi:hypothetical protein
MLLKPRFARQKVSLPPRMTSESNYNILSERMPYYLRYITRNKCVILRFLMLQLVTSEPEAVDFFSWDPTDAIIILPMRCTGASWTLALILMYPSPSLVHLCVWHFWPCTEAHLYSEVPTPLKDIIPRPWNLSTGIMSTSVIHLWKDCLPVDQETPSLSLSWSSSPDWDTLYRFLLLDSPHP